MITHDDVFQIGVLGKPHAVRGEISFHFTDDIFDRTDADYLFIETEGLLVPFFIEEYRFRSDTTALMKFCDIDNADDARELNGCKVFFPRELADSDTPSLSEIIGYDVIDKATGQTVGHIIAIDDSTINLLFEVEPANGGEAILLPAAEELIADFDREGHTITLTIPDGLLPQ